MSEKEKTHGLWQQSGVNHEGEPFVQILLHKHGKDEVFGQLTPQECREHAIGALQAAEAAEQDAFMLWFAREKIGLTLQQAGELVAEFRHWREVRSGIESGMKVVPPGHAKGEA